VGICGLGWGKGQVEGLAWWNSLYKFELIVLYSQTMFFAIMHNQWPILDMIKIF
jgi:hypothetical protein